MNEYNVNKESANLVVDARNLKCPMPLLKAKKALNSIDVGECVAVIASDPASEKDFHSFIELTAHELVQFTKEKGECSSSEFHYIIRKGKSVTGEKA